MVQNSILKMTDTENEVNIFEDETIAAKLAFTGGKNQPVYIRDEDKKVKQLKGKRVRQGHTFGDEFKSN